LQPAVAQTSSDHPISENAPVSGAPPSSPAETTQKPVDPSESAPPKAAESSDHNQPAADSTTHESLAAPSPSRDEDSNSSNDKQAASPATPKPFARKRALESPSSVDGFSRQDIPDLLRQADSSTARGNYRQARYEYGLVLKLDRNNVPAREGLRRLNAGWQSR
jgi:hypothetical protein